MSPAYSQPYFATMPKSLSWSRQPHCAGFPSPRAAHLRVATSRRCCRGSGPTAADRRESSGQANTSSETHTAVPAACPDGKLLSWAVARG
jgi:hypothetical protein